MYGIKKCLTVSNIWNLSYVLNIADEASVLVFNYFEMKMSNSNKENKWLRENILLSKTLYIQGKRSFSSFKYIYKEGICFKTIKSQ